jgi:ADP-ribose pyrophosphatase YjhB (NUDIX family)
MSKASHDSETPAHGQQVITACAFIHHEFDGVQKVFLPKRADTKKFLPGMYELVGGHIGFGEDIVAGLKREIIDELNRRVTIGDPFAAFTYENRVKGSHSIEVVYFARFVGSIGEIALNPEDHSTSHWFSEDEVVARRDEIVPSEQVDHKHIDHRYSDDPEYLAILRGFKILRGGIVNLG